jgi:hypothetical protein
MATLAKADAVFIAGSPLLSTWQVCEAECMDSDEEVILFTWEQDGQDFSEKITREDLDNAIVFGNVVTFNSGDPAEQFNLELFTLNNLEVTL